MYKSVLPSSSKDVLEPTGRGTTGSGNKPVKRDNSLGGSFTTPLSSVEAKKAKRNSMALSKSALASDFTFNRSAT